MKIGVFDSGVGGESVAAAVRKSLPQHEVVYRQDRANVPYGTKSPSTLVELVIPIFEEMIADGCRIIVVACNTVTTTIIDQLRDRFDTPLIGIEPMIKPACLSTRSKIIAVCATPATLASNRYRFLVDTYAKGVSIIEPDCSNWAYMIENREIDHKIIQSDIDDVCKKGADVIVLGCTHYHWIEKDIKKIAENYNATVIQPEKAVVEQLKRVILQLD